jgi:hypothetical protein
VDKARLDEARSALKVELERVLGPSLPGVVGFGPGFDPRSHSLGLNVLLDRWLRKSDRQDLPRSISGLPVRYDVTGVGCLE